MLLDKLHCFVGEVIGNKAITLHELSVMLERGAEVVAPVTGTKSVILIKTPTVGMVGVLHPVVPFSKGGGGIAGRLKRVGNGHLSQIHPFSPSRRGVDVAAGVVSTREKLSASGRANGTNVEPVKAGTFRRQLVNVRRAQVGITIQAEVAPPLVVGQNHHHIRSCGRWQWAGKNHDRYAEDQAKTYPLDVFYEHVDAIRASAVEIKRHVKSNMTCRTCSKASVE